MTATKLIETRLIAAAPSPRRSGRGHERGSGVEGREWSRARPRRRAGGRGPGEPGLCPQQGADRRWRRACIGRAPAAGGNGARPICSHWSAALNADPAIHGILVQLPLPKHIDSRARARRHRSGQGRRRLPRHQCRAPATGLPGLVPCTPLGCLTDAQGGAWRPLGAAGGGARALEHRRQADGATAAAAEAAPSRSRIPAPATCRRSAARRTSWSPRSAGRRWCAATGSSPARWSSMSASTACRATAARPDWSAMWPSPRLRGGGRASRRYRAASGR